VVFVIVTRTAHGLTRVQVTGLLLGFVGAVLILAPWQGTSASIGGALACLAAAASYGAGYVYMSRFLVGRNLPPLVLSTAQLIAAAGLLILAAPLGGLDPIQWRADAVISLAILGIVGTGAAYVLNYRIITDDGPVLASTVTYLLPIVAAVLGLTIGEPLTVNLVIGVALVLTGVGLTRMRQGPRTPPAPATRSTQTT